MPYPTWVIRWPKLGQSDSPQWELNQQSKLISSSSNIWNDSSSFLATRIPESSLISVLWEDSMSYWSPSKTEVLNIFWHKGLVSWKTVFPQMLRVGMMVQVMGSSWWSFAGSPTTYLLLCGQFLTGHQPDTSSTGLFICLRLPGGFPGGSVVKNLPPNAGDTVDAGSIPGSGRSLEGGNGNPLQYSCLGNPMERGVWRATVHGVAKSHTRLNLPSPGIGQREEVLDKEGNNILDRQFLGRGTQF